MTNKHKYQLPQMRDSNIELLRIVSMILVMVVHADYVSFGPPTQTDISNSFLYSFSRSGIEAISAICVNVFVLISGWFGIRYCLRRAKFSQQHRTKSVTHESAKLISRQR